MLEKFDKPFLETSELLQKLISNYNLKSINLEFKKKLLETVSYYDLINGYKECFIKNGKFDGNMTLIDIFEFHTFDKNFQNILFKYSVYAENCFKNILSYIISKRFGVDENEYLKKENYMKNFYNKKKEIKLLETLNNFKNVITSNKTDNPTKFYKKEHNHIPAWILFKNSNFSDCIDLFSFLPKEMKINIIDKFFLHSEISENDKIILFKNMLTIIRKFRNKIAHNHKIVTYRVPVQNGLIQKNMLNNSILVFNMKKELKYLFEVIKIEKTYKNLNIDILKTYIKIINLPDDIEQRIDNIMFK